MVLTKLSRLRRFPAFKYYINHNRWKQIYSESNVSPCKIFLGIQFQHSSSGKADGYNFGQQSALRVNQANDIKISNCEFSHIGMTGLFFANSNRHSTYWDSNTFKNLNLYIWYIQFFLAVLVQRYNHRGDLYNCVVPKFIRCLNPSLTSGVDFALQMLH